ncbi:MAG: protein jag [Spirochaetes bacterium]|nr:MAG: protein jag [Spirochaetota bacterium]
MIREFEGKTEKEAIDKAIAELGIDREEFDVEILETSKKGLLFRKGTVKIRVHIPDGSKARVNLEPENDEERRLKEFLEKLIEKMGFPGRVRIALRENRKLKLDISSDHSGILIGKKGKNLDSIQLILNVFAGRIGLEQRIIVDAEGYRSRREMTIVRLARRAAEQVRRSGGSQLLEPMNPFERRLIHTSLNHMRDIDTKSEGEGLYKQVRIIYKGTSRR